ncbi:P-loop containing nucleoside triphosphate hydrolase protein [Mycena alexandri]|uniref:DNA 3'-5' helicase n=1 Tax=Mycena alexandri TaxID=1745969 RepID=A0AAD6SCC6_9AGAR|nr:P-loop containing nucleoside triphosphate hydrolase protein [Mycena alexandri]
MNTPNGSATLDSREQTTIQYLHDKSLVELQLLVSTQIPSIFDIPYAYIATLNDKSKRIALIACLIVYFTSKGRIVPRQFQLESNDALHCGRDCLVDSGTGSGKTLCQIIPNLVFPDTCSMTISPLKRLQILQVPEFEGWGISVVCINEDTPKDKVLWDKIQDGGFQHLIVQPEQLKTFKGHGTRLAALLNISTFVKKITRVHIDEVHNHHTAGLASYGLPPFRPAWGFLNDLRLRVTKGTPIQALSGTLPPHIKSAVITHLNFDPKSLVSLKLSSNRPNTIYATHRIVGGLKDFRNLDFLISIPFKPLLKVIVFHDDTEQCAAAAAYGDKQLPVELRNSGVIRHYHGGMSKEYLTRVFNDFSREDVGGIDVRDIAAVIDYGIPQKKPKGLQRGGRCGRNGAPSVYLVMAEAWAFTASLDAAELDNGDPDRPIAGHLTKFSKKPERTGLAMILYVRSVVCLRRLIRDYLADVSPEALNISTPWCCDRFHPHAAALQFDKRNFFPGRFIYSDDTGAIYAGDIDEVDRVHLNPPKRKKRKTKGPVNRKMVHREPLQLRLRAWLASAHANDHLRAVRPPSFILDPTAMKKLSAVHPDRMTSVAQLVSALDETAEWGVEWGGKVLAVIKAYDTEFPQISVGRKSKAATKCNEDVESSEEETWEPTSKKAKRGGQERVLQEIPLNLRRSARFQPKV